MLEIVQNSFLDLLTKEVNRYLPVNRSITLTKPADSFNQGERGDVSLHTVQQSLLCMDLKAI